MNILFVHQNFPAQYKHLASALVRAGHLVRALSINPQQAIPGVIVNHYTVSRGNGADTHPWVTDFESKVLRGHAAASTAEQLRDQGLSPDIVCAHPGWGEALFLKDVWPNAKIVGYFEFYYCLTGADVNFDPEFMDHSLSMAARIRLKNTNNLLSLEAVDAGISPTQWQRSVFPEWAHNRIHVIHDGIDTQHVVPNPAASLRSDSAQLLLDATGEVVTFVSRTLEPTRGFHVFMRALPRILRERPTARVLIAGSEEKGYGAPRADGISWKQALLQETGGEIDLSRVLFVGSVPYPVYLAMLQISTVHVYLTYPFVLSWSMLEAMSAGCLVVGSRTAPVQEFIEHGRNGLLVDFFDINGLADTVVEALANRRAYTPIRSLARESVIETCDLQSCLPKHVALLESLKSSGI